MIITNNEAALRVECANVIPEEIGELRELLEQELINSARLGRFGIGLALPQIGIAKKMAIVRIPTQDGNEIKIDLVNAQIEKSYDLITFQDEGCLSFPGRVETTKRFNEIYITNNLIRPGSFIATGLTAIVIQHELDHLNQNYFLIIQYLRN